MLTRFIDYIKAYYRVCRLEYAPGEIPAIFTVLFLGATTVARFFDFIVLEALMVFLLLYLSGFIINALTDKEIDKRYDTFKTSIPKSVEILGENTLKAMIIAHVSIAIVLAFHITLQMSSFLPLLLVLVGAFFGLGYSIKPFHFKVRGIWHAIALGSSAFFLPFVFLMLVVADGISLPLWIFIAGFSFVHYGMEFGNQAIDYVEDKASNVRTPPVRWGMIPSLTIALCFVILGIMVEASSLYFILLTRGSFTFIHPILTTNVVYLGLVAIILAGYYIPTKGLWQMHSTLIHSKSIESGMPTLKKICNYAKWQASGILGVATVSAILFLGVAFEPITNISQDDDHNNLISGDLQIASQPIVKFYEDDGSWYANVTISVLNDNIERQWGSIVIRVESFTANIRIGITSLLLEEDLEPNTYWNKSTVMQAHDVDDTTIRVTLYIPSDQSGLNEDLTLDKRVVPCEKKLYIYNAYATGYEEHHDKKANVTVFVYNEGDKRFIGDMEVRVWYYYGAYQDYESQKNDLAIDSNKNWIPILPVNALEFDDVSEPFFVVKLFYKGDFVDEYTFSGYS